MRLPLALVLMCGLAAFPSSPVATVSGGAQLPVVELDPLTNGYSPELRATLAALGKAVGDYGKGRYEAAAAQLADAEAAQATALADYFLLYRAKALLESGRGREALDLFRSLQGLTENAAMRREAVLGEVRTLLELRDPAAAASRLDGSGMAEGAESLFLRGQAKEAEKRPAEAVPYYLRIYANYVNSRFSPLAERRLATLAPGFAARSSNRESLLVRGENLIRAGRNQEARSLLLRLADLKNAGPIGQKACLLLAEADTNLGRLTEALKYLQRATDAEAAPKGAYLKAVCYRGLNRESAFLEARDRALREFPDSPFTEKLLYSVATYFDVRNDAGRAREAYQAIADRFPNGEHFKRALWKIALDSYVSQRYPEALAGFARCLTADTSPAAAAASAYWMGRCCRQLGWMAQAAGFFSRVQAIANNSYYGQRAGEVLESLPAGNPDSRGDGTEFDAFVRILDTVEPEMRNGFHIDGAAARIIERCRQLAAAGLLDLALAEVGRGLEDRDGRDQVLALAKSRIHLGMGDILGAITTVRRAYPDYAELPPDSLPAEVWDVLFPVRHLDLVTRHAARNRLDPDLVLALIRQESAFAESARSPANARGLMQILPSTGRLLARQAGISRYSVARLYQADTNIALGTRHLSALLDRYGGKVELALAAYNAGDNRVDRWLAEFGQVDMAEFVERIPFSETRGYVKQVLSNRAHYRIRTAPHPAGAGESRRQ